MIGDNNSSMHNFHDRKTARAHGGSGIAGGIYFMSFIGAAVYYIMQAATFWGGVLGFLKAIVWPGMLIFRLFEFLKM